MFGQSLFVIVLLAASCITPTQSYTMQVLEESLDADLLECFVCAYPELPESPLLRMSNKFACLQEHPNRAHKACLQQWAERPNARCPFCRAAIKHSCICEFCLPINQSPTTSCTKFKKHGIRLLGIACSLSFFCFLNSQN